MVRFEDGSTMRLYRQTVTDFGLYAGKELSEEEWKSLQEAAGLMSAKMRAVRILSASDVSKGDMQRRLVQKGEDAQDARKAVQWLEDLDLIDDSKTARQVVARCISKGYGKARAKQALYEKRIPKEYWDEALEDYPDQQDNILTFLESRLGNQPDEKTKKKAVDALIRRGHSYSAIRKAMETLSVDIEDFRED
ncbi:MAG: RecX family transcriptional regulator [Oscillospiraceae bacterium]|nr:RecX family transcriptional regulator [Oscillospiraceae bacterium]